ncbi:MAG: pyruvate formate lyase family protein [Planctomycetota bacterium]|nr:pyruvate formate lyase family protein [Planctomycetota bacterium]
MITQIQTDQDRIESLIATKLENTRAKQKLGPMDTDDHGSILLPEKVDFVPKPNHGSGGSYGPKSVGENFGALLNALPATINPDSSLAGAWYFDAPSYRCGPGWPLDAAFDYSHLQEDFAKYNIISGIGGGQHFCPDLQIGFDLGWGGILEKIQWAREDHPESSDFYDGHEATVVGIQSWIRRHVRKALELSMRERRTDRRENLIQMAAMNEHLVSGPPRTFREACQFISWVAVVTRTFNGAGAMGQLDELLRPFYEKDIADGILDDEEAIYHLISMLVIDTQYYQVGGPDENGMDKTSHVSFLILEALHILKIPSNITVMVWDGLDPELFDRAVTYLFDDKVGSPRFMGAKGLYEGFARNGYTMELARQRIACGCHWIAIPGREYTLNDIVKINAAKVFDVAFRDFMSRSEEKNVDALWGYFDQHLRKAIEVTKQGIDFHLAHQKDVCPEVPLNLLCHGPIERGRDVTDGGVDYYNMCIDLSALATAADSFAAIEKHVDTGQAITCVELLQLLDDDWSGAEHVRLMLKNSRRFGCGDSPGDKYAVRLSERFTEIVKECPTPDGFNCIPGIFSWASTIPLGRAVGATPNGRFAGEPISHGASPDPGYDGKGSGAPTSLSNAVVSVQCGYGNTIPLQLDMDPGLGSDEKNLALVKALIRTHFDQGGTLINMNILNREQILAAHEDPSLFPDLIVRVTGFSAYFASLSKEFRQLVVDRIVGQS